MNIILFGPNGSGKGTQGNLIKNQFGLAHIESGGIFRENIGKGTELGKKAKVFIDKGDLVPDEITIPMVLDALQKNSQGWILDGFPRTPAQSEQLWEAIVKANLKLNYVIEIDLARDAAQGRILGRRTCSQDVNHPNNINISAIRPKDDRCHICEAKLTARADDLDLQAIHKRHDIYYDAKTGTIAAALYFKELAARGLCKYIVIDGLAEIKKVKEDILKELKA